METRSFACPKAVIFIQVGVLFLGVAPLVRIIIGAVEILVAEEIFRASRSRLDEPVLAALNLQVVLAHISKSPLAVKAWRVRLRPLHGEGTGLAVGSAGRFTCRRTAGRRNRDLRPLTERNGISPYASLIRCEFYPPFVAVGRRRLRRVTVGSKISRHPERLVTCAERHIQPMISEGCLRFTGLFAGECKGDWIPNLQRPFNRSG